MSGWLGGVVFVVALAALLWFGPIHDVMATRDRTASDQFLVDCYVMSSFAECDAALVEFDR